MPPFPPCELPPSKPDRAPLRLYNLLVPFIAWELSSVILILLVIAAVEAVVLSQILQVKRWRFLRAAFFMNVITTLVGYAVQGIGRLLSLIVILNHLPNDLAYSPFFDGLMGNFGIGVQRPLLTFVVNLATSVLLAFILSAGIEYFVLRYFLRLSVGDRPLWRAVVLANLASYALLSVWLLFQLFAFYLPSLQDLPPYLAP